jgi:hypothetical protein
MLKPPLPSHTCARSHSHTHIRTAHLQGNSLATAGIIRIVRGSRAGWDKLGVGVSAWVWGIPKEETSAHRLGSGPMGTLKGLEAWVGAAKDLVRFRTRWLVSAHCSPQSLPSLIPWLVNGQITKSTDSEPERPPLLPWLRVFFYQASGCCALQIRERGRG